MALQLVCTTEEMIHVRINPLTATGKPAVVDGNPVWSVVTGNGTVGAIDADGLGAFLKSTGIVDGIDTVFMVSADADLGPGIVSIQDTATLTTTNAQAASLGFVADPAVPKV